MLISQNIAYPETASKIVTTKTAREVLENIQNIPKDAVIFLDIDDTIITPISKTFRVDPYKRLIDDIKQKREQYKNYEIIVSNWRLQRKITLVDNAWPEVINKLKKLHMVYGLTKMDSGQFGNIESMEKWRFNELHSLKIDFSQNKALQKHIIQPAKIKDNPVFYNGIFITGASSKSQVLKFYNRFFTNFIVLVDDRLEHLHDIRNYCNENSIGFLGVLFTGVENLPDNPNPKIVQFQKDHLIKNAEWLEDDEAERRHPELVSGSQEM